jgi:hypothetical protein
MNTYNRSLFRAIICSSLLLLVGCASYEPLPDIVESKRIEPTVVSTKVIQPQPKPEPEPDTKFSDFPKEWLPPAQAEKKWMAIVLHHSATETGNAAIFDRMHREQNHWDGIGYDFVIGNGTDSGDGEVEVTFRWREQIAGAHCGGTPENWANEDAVGICLVGNFDYSMPTAEQMQSLSELISFLKLRYGISNSRIYGHRSTPGARVTDCPGKMFPMARLKSMFGS